MERKSGVVMHISSLPSPYGIGTFGKEARQFVDFLADAKQTYWQILPLSETSYGDSPYQSYSTFAGNPYFIDLDILNSQGLIKKSDYKNINWGNDANRVDYKLIYDNRFAVLKKAALNFLNKKDLTDYKEFLRNNKWVNDYALFKHIKSLNDYKGLIDWDKKYHDINGEAVKKIKKDDASETQIYKVIQYFFYNQWFELKKYANEKGILIIGDCPIYVANDSCDVWANRELFEVDEDLKPISVAAVPPDGFTADGQLWGNPLYRWDVHKKTKFKWWINRVNHLCAIYDYLRIDHFRGLSSFYSVKYGEKTARDGVWRKGPGEDLIKAIKTRTNNQIIVEDLGYMDDDVKELLAYSEYPGMAILEFGFDMYNTKHNENASYNLKKNQVVYFGSHDSETMMGWLKSISLEQLDYTKRFVNYDGHSKLNWTLISFLLSTRPDTALILAQDLLELDNNARMNEPGTLGNNWVWRANKGDFNLRIAKRLKEITELYGRD